MVAWRSTEVSDLKELSSEKLKKKYDEILRLYRASEITRANEELQELLAMAREEDDHYYYAVGLNFMGALQIALGNQSRAIDFYFESMIYSEKFELKSVLALVYNNIAARYMEALDFETALIYLKKVEVINLDEAKNNRVEPRVQRDRAIIFSINIALAYTNTGEYEKSIEYLDQAEKMMEGNPIQDMDFTCGFLRCQDQYHLGNMEYVKEHLDYLLEGIENLNSLFSYEHNINDMFKFLLQLGDKSKILKLITIVDRFVTKQEKTDFEMMACKMRSEYELHYGTQENYQKSCVKLVELYQKKEQDAQQERKEYMALRMRMKKAEVEWNEEEVRQKELLTKALEEAKRANTAKSEFLSRMSHEIRTPLNAIIGYSTMSLNHLEQADKIKDYQEKSQIAAKHLLSIINDVLDSSAIASGHFKIEKSEFDFKQIIRDVNSMFRQQALNKRVKFNMELSEVYQEFLIGDSLRVKQILLNLLSNAMKFTPEGGTITLLVEQKIEKFVQMKFYVKDTGMGMSEEFLNRMFTPFEQQDASISRKYGGTGLGLSISQQLTELMDGSIEVESKEQEGTTFLVRIPFVAAENKGDGEVLNQNLIKTRTLFVTLDEKEEQGIKTLFRKLRMKVDTAKDEEHALRQLEIRNGGAYEYQMCLIEETLGEESGTLIAKRIREQFGKDIVLILLVDYRTSRIEDAAINAGVNQVVEKPLFLSTIREMILKHQGGMAEKSEEVGTKIDFSGTHVLLAEDNEMNMEIAEDILIRANFIVEKAFDGKEAYEKFKKSEQGTYQAILMDIQMPEMDGYEATKAIRTSRHPDAEKIPIVALTANAFHEDVTRALEAGMDGHIAKPINVRELYEQLGKLMKTV